MNLTGSAAVTVANTIRGVAAIASTDTHRAEWLGVVRLESTGDTLTLAATDTYRAIVASIMLPGGVAFDPVTVPAKVLTDAVRAVRGKRFDGGLTVDVGGENVTVSAAGAVFTVPCGPVDRFPNLAPLFDGATDYVVTSADKPYAGAAFDPSLLAGLLESIAAVTGGTPARLVSVATYRAARWQADNMTAGVSVDALIMPQRL